MKSIHWSQPCSLLILLTAAPAFGQTISKTDPSGNAFGETWQQSRHCQGKSCPGVRTAHECGPNQIRFSPNPIVAKQGQPMTVRFDATAACNGQSVEDFSGTVTWKAGSVTPLADSYGFGTYTYSLPGFQQIRMQMSYRCTDTSGASSCSSVGVVSVNVAPRARADY
jgi:hypothetical protein